VQVEPGTFQTAGAPLAPGSSYQAKVYVPRSTDRQQRTAGTKYPEFTRSYLAIGLPQVLSRTDARAVSFPPFGSDEPVAADFRNGFQPSGGTRAIQSSVYARMYQLALTLKAQAKTPFDYVRAVLQRVQNGASYSESPPPSRVPLVDFVFNSKLGYCQQFSGAMALLLRMGGVPARVASGFSPGRFDRKRSEYVVRDDDAHSWVEAYFPKYGWIPFEPTPTRNLPEVQASTTNASWVRSIGDQKNASQFGIQSHQLRRRLGAVGPHVTNPAHGHGSGGGGSPDIVAARSGGHSFFLWALSAAAILIAALATVKLVAVRWRYLRRGPRGQASAAYHELATYIGDQGVRVNANATFEELAGLVEHTWGVDASPLAKAGSAARYAPPAIADRAGHEVRPALRRIRRDLRKSIDLRDRAMGSLRLRSMLAQTTHLD
jgi:transglutaminase-like putative cysteine protease